MSTAIFAAGCFWGVQAGFDRLPGVTGTTVGYVGGKTQKPTYEQVCTDTTGHAEAVAVEYDPARTSYAALLKAFFQLHDPTQLNRQGPDMGTQYRTAVFVQTEEEREAVEAAIAAENASGRHKRPLATVIEPAGTFWPAEEYHQKYLAKRGQQACHI